MAKRRVHRRTLTWCTRERIARLTSCQAGYLLVSSVTRSHLHPCGCQPPRQIPLETKCAAMGCSSQFAGPVRGSCSLVPRVTRPPTAVSHPFTAVSHGSTQSHSHPAMSWRSESSPGHLIVSGSRVRTVTSLIHLSLMASSNGVSSFDHKVPTRLPGCIATRDSITAPFGPNFAIHSYMREPQDSARGDARGMRAPYPLEGRSHSSQANALAPDGDWHGRTRLQRSEGGARTTCAPGGIGRSRVGGHSEATAFAAAGDWHGRTRLQRSEGGGQGQRVRWRHREGQGLTVTRRRPRLQRLGTGTSERVCTEHERIEQRGIDERLERDVSARPIKGLPSPISMAIARPPSPAGASWPARSLAVSWWWTRQSPRCFGGPRARGRPHWPRALGRWAPFAPQPALRSTPAARTRSSRST